MCCEGPRKPQLAIPGDRYVVFLCRRVLGKSGKCVKKNNHLAQSLMRVLIIFHTFVYLCIQSFKISLLTFAQVVTRFNLGGGCYPFRSFCTHVPKASIFSPVVWRCTIPSGFVLRTAQGVQMFARGNRKAPHLQAMSCKSQKATNGRLARARLH